MAFGDRVRQLRRGKNIGIKVLAKHCGVNVAYLSRVEAGKVSPSQSLIEKLAHVLHHDQDELSLLAQKLPETWLSWLATDPETAMKGLRRSLEEVSPDDDNGRVSEPISAPVASQVKNPFRLGVQLLTQLSTLHHTEQYEDAYASWATYFKHLEDSTRQRFDLYVALTHLFFDLLATRSEEYAHWVLPQLQPDFWLWFSPVGITTENSFQWSVDLLQDTYTALNQLEDTRAYGKVFTPPAIAAYILKRSGFPGKARANDYLLDPAAGCGVFFMKALDCLAQQSPKNLSHWTTCLVGMEMDPGLCNLARLNIAFWFAQNKVAAPAESLPIFCTDTLSERGLFSGSTQDPGIEVKDLVGRYKEGFRWIVGNPPYGKIHSSDLRVAPFKETVYGHANLYGLFLHFSLTHLEEQRGVLGIIIPKSFSSGLYFKELRAYLLKNLRLREIVTFESRTEVFDKADILQETVILLGDKRLKKTSVKVLSPRSYQDLNNHPPANVISLNDLDLGQPYDHILCITGSREAITISRLVRNRSVTLRDAGFRASTGKFVWNRFKPHLRDAPGKNVLPLYWMHSLKPFKFLPNAVHNRHLAFVELNGVTRPWLNVPEDLVITKRISAKEQKRRIEAAHIPASWRADTPGYFLENHLNFIARVKPSPYSLIFVMGVLNSKLLDFVFRVFNGNTQVSATELNVMPLVSDDGRGQHEVERITTALMDIQDEDTSELEEQLNKAVYRLYGIGKKEQVYIENFFKSLGR